MWPLLMQVLYKRKLHRLYLNSKWTFVGNTINKVIINTLLVISYPCFTTHKTFLQQHCYLLRIYIGTDIDLVHLLHVILPFIF